MDSQKQAAERNSAEAETAGQIEALEGAVKTHLSKEALQRYGTLKLAHPETAVRLIMALAQLIEAGRIKGMLSEEQLKGLLKQISALTQGRATRIIHR